MVRVIDRVANAPTLLIKRIAAETNALIASGAPVLNLSQGAPNLPMFDAAHSAAVAALSGRKLQYTDVEGDSSVRQVCADFLNQVVLGGSREVYRDAHVCLTNGAVGAVYTSLAIQISSPDDVVASPLPCYGLYRSDTTLLGGTFVPLDVGTPDDGFTLSPSDIHAAFEEHGDNLRCLIICSPNNPTGRCFTDEEARLLAEELDKQLQKYPDFSVILDEVYTGIASSHTSILKHASSALIRSCLVTISASKGLGGAPGARSGFVAVADEELVSQLIKIQMAIGANVSVPSQAILCASLAHVLSDPNAIIGGISRFYSTRTDFVCSRLERIGEELFGDIRALCPRRPDGTFYVLARLQKLATTDLECVRSLRDAYKTEGVSHGVAVVPLSAFDVDEKLCIVRICCALDLEVLEQAMGIIEAVLKLSL